MAQTRVRGYRIGLVLALVSSGILAGFGLSPATAEVTAVKGSAYGYFSRISLFGGPAADRGPAPTVTLPAGGSATPVTSTAATGDARYGPGIFFTSGKIDVSTEGTPAGGSVTSKTTITNINTSTAEVLTAAGISSTCTASSTGVTGSTTITNGRLEINEGDPAVTGDETFVDVPTNPDKNTSYNGKPPGVDDTFRYIFNEQITNADGSLTVNAAHQVAIGPTAVGDLIVGQVVCGVTATAAGATTTTAAAGATTTTAAPGATTTTAAPGATTTTAAPGATTTTATPGATTTTTSGTTTTGVGGGAYGFFTSVGLFGGAPATRGPEPAVTLPAAGADPPLTATAASGRAVYGPAEIFTSGKIDVSTQGTTGANASVKSSASVANVGPGPINATGATSNCSASQSGATGSATITGGKLTTSEGKDLDSPNAAADDTVVDLPANPAPNTTFSAKLETVGDTFKVVLNEQTTGTGSITVNAIHMYLLGPTAVGDAIIGQSRCSTTTSTAGGAAGGGAAGGAGGGGSVATTGTDALRLLAFGLFLLAGGSITTLEANRRWGRRRRPTGPTRTMPWPKRGLLH